MTEQIEKLLDTLSTTIQNQSRYYIDVLHVEQLAQVLFVVGDSGVQVIGCPFADRADVVRFALQLPALLRKFNAKGYLLVGELWATKSTRPSIEHIGVADLPLDDRFEVATIVGGILHGKEIYLSAKITSSRDGRKLGEFILSNDRNNRSRFVITEW